MSTPARTGQCGLCGVRSSRLVWRRVGPGTPLMVCGSACPGLQPVDERLAKSKLSLWALTDLRRAEWTPFVLIKARTSTEAMVIALKRMGDASPDDLVLAGPLSTWESARP